MRVVLIKHIYGDVKGTHCTYEVRGDDHEPGAVGVLFGIGNLTLHSGHTPEEIAEAVWQKAEDIRDVGLANWELHNRIAPLIKQKAEGQ